MKIKITKVTSHRNGVGGDPFYTVEFVYEVTKLIAIVPAEYIEPAGKPFYSCPCFVIEPANPQAGYRGDLFMDVIRNAIIKHHQR